jgi:hypothetical protein
MGDIEHQTRWAAAFEVQVVAKDIIDWVYGLQVLPLNGDGNSTFEDGNSKLPRLQPSSAAVNYIPSICSLSFCALGLDDCLHMDKLKGKFVAARMRILLTNFACFCHLEPLTGILFIQVAVMQIPLATSYLC